MPKPMTPEQIKRRCARAVCEGCRQDIPLVLRDVVYENNLLMTQQALVHITENAFEKACDANDIYKIPDEELT